MRIPAALNGIVGFKPTARRVPLDGAFPLSYTLDSIGPLARSVEACAVTDSVMAGEEPYLPAPFPLAGLRIGVPRGRLFEEVDSVVAQAFESTLARLSAAGARIVDHGIEDLLDGMADATRASSIASVEAAEVHADWLDAKADTIDPRVRNRIVVSAQVPAPVYIRTMRRRSALCAAMDERLAPVDVLALPAVPVVAPLIAPLVEDDDLYVRTNLLILRNTMVANQFDLTGISLPVPGSPLPAGFMLFGRNGHDRRLLRIAAGVEAELAGADRR